MVKGLLRNFFWVRRYALGTFFVSPHLDLGRAEVGLGIGRMFVATLAYPWLAFLIFAEFAMLITAWVGAGIALARIVHRGLSRSAALILIPLCAALLLIAAAFPASEGDRYRIPAMPMLALVAAFGWTTHPGRSTEDVEQADQNE
jgi:hypothetical protein